LRHSKSIDSSGAKIVQRNATGDTHHTFNPTTGWTTPFTDIEILIFILLTVFIRVLNLMTNIKTTSSVCNRCTRNFYSTAKSIGNKIQRQFLGKIQEQIQQQLIQLVGTILRHKTINSLYQPPQKQLILMRW
jgi:hypothetical protein